jgi:hypothetical protein
MELASAPEEVDGIRGGGVAKKPVISEQRTEI